jgi:hypothetical protein
LASKLAEPCTDDGGRFFGVRQVSSETAADAAHGLTPRAHEMHADAEIAISLCDGGHFFCFEWRGEGSPLGSTRVRYAEVLASDAGASLATPSEPLKQLSYLRALVSTASSDTPRLRKMAIGWYMRCLAGHVDAPIPATEPGVAPKAKAKALTEAIGRRKELLRLVFEVRRDRGSHSISVSVLLVTAGTPHKSTRMRSTSRSHFTYDLGEADL